MNKHLRNGMFVAGMLVSINSTAADAIPLTTKPCPTSEDELTFDVTAKGEDRIIITQVQPLFFLVDKPVINQKLLTGTGSEVARQTELITNLGDLANAIISKERLNAADHKGSTKFCAEFDPKLLRSKLTISLTVKQKEDDKDTTPVTKVYTVGPAEHVYISADVPVTDAKQLKLDSTSNKVVTASTPTTFYLGVNYQLGDIFTKYAWDKGWNNIVIKAIFQASSKPASSVGLGIGYVTEFCNVFIARVSTTSDSSVSASSTARTQSTIAGLSFNISNVANWISGK